MTDLTRHQRILAGTFLVLVIAFATIAFNPPKEQSWVAVPSGIANAPKANPSTPGDMVVWCDGKGLHVRHSDGGQDDLGSSLAGITGGR